MYRVSFPTKHNSLLQLLQVVCYRSLSVKKSTDKPSLMPLRLCSVIQTMLCHLVCVLPFRQLCAILPMLCHSKYDVPFRLCSTINFMLCQSGYSVPVGQCYAISAILCHLDHACLNNTCSLF